MGDHLTLRNIFREYLQQEKHRKRWSKQHFVNYRGMENAKKIYEQLLDYSLQQLGHQAELIVEVNCCSALFCQGLKQELFNTARFGQF